MELGDPVGIQAAVDSCGGLRLLTAEMGERHVGTAHPRFFLNHHPLGFFPRSPLPRGRSGWGLLRHCGSSELRETLQIFPGLRMPPLVMWIGPDGPRSCHPFKPPTSTSYSWYAPPQASLLRTPLLSAAAITVPQYGRDPPDQRTP